MDLKQALDFLASNCPTVFQPISEEIGNLRKEKKDSDDKMAKMQEAIDFLVMGGM